MSLIYFDTETRSEIDLRRTGVYPYAQNHSTEIVLASWAVDDGPAQDIDLTVGDSRDELLELLQDDDNRIIIHNSMFDRTMIRHKWLLDIPLSRIWDTQAQARAHGLPASLDALCKALGLPADKQKDVRGRQLINMFCKPFRGRWRDRHTHPKEWAEFREYARQDIVAMREAQKLMPMWNYPQNRAERRIFAIDQRINDSGIYVDMDFVHRAQALAEEEKARIASLVEEMGAPRPSRRVAFVEHLEGLGVALPNLTKDTVMRTIETLPEGDARTLLQLRLEYSQTSVAKYKAFQDMVCEDDDLIRGSLIYCGASRTGRWSGSGVQFQNMANPSRGGPEIDANIAGLKGGFLDLTSRDKAMDFLSDAVRSCVMAPPGFKIVDADLSNIEGRVLAWLAGEEWKLQAFRDFDAGIGHDLYILAYARAFGVDPAGVGRGLQRDIGKVMELFLGYQGGVGAYMTGAETYHLDLQDIVDAVNRTATPAQIDASRSFYEWMRSKKMARGVPAPIYVACNVLKQAWRDRHPATTALWELLENQISKAIQNPGVTFPIGDHLKARRSGSWLRLRLPSGRELCYLHPMIDGDGISAMGVDQETRRWERKRMWGGVFAENCSQAVARDILAHAMPECFDRGYHIALHVHDQLVAYAPDSPDYNPEGLIEIMTRQPDWAKGLPLAADGREGQRFHKY